MTHSMGGIDMDSGLKDEGYISQPAYTRPPSKAPISSQRPVPPTECMPSSLMNKKGLSSSRKIGM
jgi:hypothetical protein